ncbi:hypothetical protein [Streptomyces xantholiticus]|uniref:hypothetical protein n=1 Tax=Streptomyces xantholiticus TaxID=68285 RepID=UPI003D9DFF00
MIADDEHLAFDASFPGGPVGSQDVDVEVVVAGESDRFRVQRDRLTWGDVASDDGLGAVVDDRHRDPAEVSERAAVAVEEGLEGAIDNGEFTLDEQLAQLLKGE